MLKAFISRTKPMTLMIIGLSVIFGGLILFNVGKGLLIRQFFKNFQPPAVTVASVDVQEKSWQPNLHAVGAFVAVNGVDINAEASGSVVNIHFKSGEMVKKDTLLVDIDDSVDKATLKANEADLVLQQVNYKRQAQLLKRNATSQSEVDTARAGMLEAESKVEHTRAVIAQKHIKAPFTGRLGIRMINLGEYITTGRTNIVTLQSLDPLFLEFYVPEQQLSRIHVGQNILFSVEPNTAKLFSGKITAINAKADTQTHNVKIQAAAANCPPEVFDESRRSHLIEAQKIPNTGYTKITCNTEKNQAANLEKYAFIPGMFTSISIEQPAVSGALVLPTTAISYSLYGDSVFLIEPQVIDNVVQKNDKGEDILVVRRVFVTTGDEEGNQIVIKKGVKAGQKVVSAGEVKLQNGTHVVINNDVPLNTDNTMSNLSE
ncbi:MAG: efflux RND transporter periplasmic adaptor subunit [Legionellaceae bacterium]|nr:efflux RND transporter periplasmic adaptor subunit [Legionellaceae bacterium]